MSEIVELMSIYHRITASKMVRYLIENSGYASMIELRAAANRPNIQAPSLHHLLYALTDNRILGSKEKNGETLYAAGSRAKEFVEAIEKLPHEIRRKH